MVPLVEGSCSVRFRVILGNASSYTLRNPLKIMVWVGRGLRILWFHPIAMGTSLHKLNYSAVCPGWNVPTAGSGPQVPEGELQILFVLTITCANPQKIVISIFFWGVNPLWGGFSWKYGWSVCLIYKADRTINLKKIIKTPIHKNNRYWDSFWDKILLKVGDTVPFFLFSKVVRALMFLQLWISKPVLWCTMAWQGVEFSTSALQISNSMA